MTSLAHSIHTSGFRSQNPKYYFLFRIRNPGSKNCKVKNLNYHHHGIESKKMNNKNWKSLEAGDVESFTSRPTIKILPIKVNTVLSVQIANVFQ